MTTAGRKSMALFAVLAVQALWPALVPAVSSATATAAAATVTEAAPSTEPAGLALDQWRGKVVWLDFWASWCIPCRESFPWMEEMRRKYEAQGLVVITVNVDRDRAAADRFLAGQQVGFHHIFDPEGELAEAHGLEAMPTSILHDRAGRPAFRHSGFRAEETEEYERHIVALLDSGVEAAPLAAPPDQNGADTEGGVRPWERDLLALQEMRLDADILDLEFDDHIYFSKEASSGGRGFGGGGCGCN